MILCRPEGLFDQNLMDLFSGLPFWLIKDGLRKDAPVLSENISCDILIIGSGITGALVAHELCNSGFDCVVIDKRFLSGGSTLASTAQLQYEIDVPLHQLIKKIGVQKAVDSYFSSLYAISDLEEILKQTHTDADFEKRSSLYLASDKKGVKEIGEEYRQRTQYGLPVEYLNAEKLNDQYHFNNYQAALYTKEAAIIDAYKACAGIFSYHEKKNALRLFARTAVTEWARDTNGFQCKTDTGYAVKSKFVVCACGYEAGDFLPEKVMNLNSTYVIITQPLQNELWYEESLIWETTRPYFFMRTTDDNRIIAGGEDIKFKNAFIRDRLMHKKSEILLEKLHDRFLFREAKIDFSWCGTFSETKDGLPYIGEYPGKKGLYFALGYGGNGITFSVIAAQVIRNQLLGRHDKRADLFSFAR